MAEEKKKAAPAGGAKGPGAAKKKVGLGKGRHKSAIKRARQSETRYARNISIISAMKTQMRRVRKAVEAKNKKDAETALKTALPSIARASNKGVVHHRTAARYASRLTKAVQAI